MKKILIALVALLLLAMVPSALAMTVSVKDITNGTVSVQIGETIPIQVTYTASSDMNDTVIKAELVYKGKDIDDTSKVLDMKSGTTYTEALSLTIPANIKVDANTGRDYTISVRMYDGNGDQIGNTSEFSLLIQRANEAIAIQKVMTSMVKSGEPLIVTIVVKNTGSDTVEDLYARVSIPELGSTVYAEEVIGDLASTDQGKDKDTAVKDIALRIPANAEDGTYTIQVEVSNDDDVKTSSTKSIYIDGVTPAEKFVEVVPSVLAQDIAQGKTAIYDLRIANIGDTTKTFSVYVEGTDGWASYKLNPLSVSLLAESSQVITVAVTAADNALGGEHKFTVRVVSDDAEKTVSLTANVNAKGGVDTLLISVIVLAIVLVVLIAILVKTRKSGDELPEAEESYY